MREGLSNQYKTICTYFKGIKNIWASKDVKLVLHYFLQLQNFCQASCLLHYHLLAHSVTLAYICMHLQVLFTISDCSFPFNTMIHHGCRCTIFPYSFLANNDYRLCIYCFKRKNGCKHI